MAKSPPNDASLHFGKNVVIHNNKPSGLYKDRVFYDPGTFQWCLLQLHEPDSGKYSFTVTKNDIVEIETFMLVVEGKGLFFLCADTLLCSCSVDPSD